MTEYAVLQAKNLTQHYQIADGFLKPKKTLKAVQSVNFDLHRGKTLAVVGESGCGKSTLARMLTMIESPSNGQLVLDQTAVVPALWPKLRTSVQIVFQDPYGSLNPRQRVGQILMEPLVINRPDLSQSDRQARARDMLTLVGLRPEHFDRYPHMFSGGQRQRIAIARGLMLDPRILVLDEPVSALDVSIQSSILNLLVELQDRLNLAYVFISHDLSVVRHIADDVIVMYLGRAVERGPKRDVFDAPRHPYTKALLSATPTANPTHRKQRIKLRGELPSPLNAPTGCPFAPRCWKATEICQTKMPSMTEGIHSVACFHPEGQG